MSYTYNPPSGSYTSRIPPGMVAIRTYMERRWGISVQIVRNQSRCNSSPSEHCECRATDGMTSFKTKRREMFDWGRSLFDKGWCQSVIADRRVAGFGNVNERNYTGPSPHTDHTHLGWTKWAAQNVTLAMLEGEDDDMPTIEEIRAVVQEELDKRIGKPNEYGPGATTNKALYKKVGETYVEHLDLIEGKLPK